MTCNHKGFSQFVIGSKAVAKMYLMVHLIPFLLFKRKKVRQKYPCPHSALSESSSSSYLASPNHSFSREAIRAW